MSVETEALLKEIDAENPCGEDLEYDPEFIALEQAIKGKPEQQIGDTIQEAEPPNWKEVRKAVENLLARTRDLRVLIYYFRALSALEGLYGFAQGLDLINKLTAVFWQDIHPQLDPDDDNDPTERVNILMSLCDFETSLKPLQRLAMVESRTFGKFSLRDLRIAEGQETPPKTGDETPDLSSINGAFQDCEGEQLLATAQSLSASLQSLNELENFVTEQVGVGAAPSFAELRKLLKEIDAIVSEWVERRGLNVGETVADTETGTDIGEGGVPQAKTSVSSGIAGINSSEDVRRTLNLICEYYKKHEPSSPVPILLQRVIRLIGKDFMEIMKDMAPNGVEQIEFLRGTSEDSKSASE